MSPTHPSIYKVIFESLANNATNRETDHAFRQIVNQRYHDHVEPNELDSFGFTLLHWAAYCGQYSSVRVLLENTDANIANVGTEEFPLANMSALALATGNGFSNVVQLLLEASTEKSMLLAVPFLAPSLHDIISTLPPQDFCFKPLDIALLKKHVDAIQVLLMPTVKEMLKEYINNRLKESDYTSFFHAGFSKRQKLNAAMVFKDILESPLLTKEMLIEFAKVQPAIKQGRLGQIFYKFKDNFEPILQVRHGYQI